MKKILVASFLIYNCISGLSQKPIDPQVVQDQDSMTWSDYKPIPGKNWADPSLSPVRKFRMALIAVDFPDQPFVITRPENSDLFGNPQISPVKREDVPVFYSDFWLKPSAVNHWQTINGYWMEQSRGKFGITILDPFGPYRMPKNLWEYGLNEYNQNNSTPDGSRAKSRMEPDIDSLWKDDAGDIKEKYDAILRIYAGYDETGVWQEFGEMKFLSKDEIPAEWGNPDTSKPAWVPTRYVPWTSWKAGQMQWGLSSIRQGENSGTITHELGHYAFDIGDNNNNPYAEPYRRVGSGPWDMMDRGSFNGPGGPHMRWVVPANMGAAMPAGLMLRNRMINGFIPEKQVLSLSREDLAKSGPVVTKITARAVEPLPGTFAGIIVRLDGAEPRDRTPADDPATNPLSPGIPNFDYYSLEVVQRIGYDSFCPDNGVLLAKNKDKESRNGGPNGFNCFNWVIDAHPEDINMIDYIKPDGRKVMRTVADYRQLNDALFHAGLNSGSLFEWEDEANRLHFYIIDVNKNDEGILSYEVGVRSLDGVTVRKRDVSVSKPSVRKIKGNNGYVTFTVKNTGESSAADTSMHHQNTLPWLNSDIYRLSVNCEGKGCSASLLNEIISLKPGETGEIPVYVSFDKVTRKEKISLTVTPESEPGVRVFCSSVIKFH
ncbi:MAG TPA: peptidase M6 [Bacteroidales bacterium]|nr:peptidase M6 [Bacteroidales bacterium]HBZ20275.1 peptidase M6 [Bacteroidales bacterium]